MLPLSHNILLHVFYYNTYLDKMQDVFYNKSAEIIKIAPRSVLGAIFITQSPAYCRAPALHLLRRDRRLQCIPSYSS